MGFIEQELQQLIEGQAAILKLLKEKKEEPQERIYDQSAVVQMFSVSLRTLSEWRKAGKISFSQCSGKIYYTEQNIQDFLQKYSVKSFKK